MGREVELISLSQRLLEQRSVLVVGDVGVGKTTLLRGAAQTSGRRVFEGGALATLSWLSFLPLARALRTSLPSDEDDVLDIVERIVGDGLLLLDDLQWADDETLGLLPRLASRVSVAGGLRRGDQHEASVLTAAAMVAEVVVLEGLSQDDTVRLGRHLAPDLAEAELLGLAERSGGNPLLLQGLLSGSGETVALRASVERRVDAASPEVRRALVLLHLVGRSVEQDLIGAAAGEAVGAGLVVRRGNRLSLANALTGEVAAASVGGEERRQVHRRLARLVQDPGEAARHHAAAGEQAEAVARATEAARAAGGPEERARHLELAAGCAAGPAADRLRLDAALALLAVGRPGAAHRLASEVKGTGEAAGDALVVRVQARARLGDPEGARALAEEGLATAGEASAEPLGLAVELAGLLAWPLWQPASALALARRCVDGAGAAPSPSARRTRVVLARALAVAGEAGWEEQSRRCVAEAAAAEDGEGVVRALAGLALGQVLAGRLEAARETVASLASPRDAVLSAALVLHLEAGWSQAEHECRRLLADDRAAAHRDLAAAHLALALSDSGRTGDALGVVATAWEASPSPVGAATLWWVQAEVELAAGRLRRSRAAASACRKLGLAGFPATSLASVVDAWACFEGGEAVEPTFDLHARAVPAVPAELSAVAAMADGANDEAERRFVEAAGMWEAASKRSALRCAWAAGEAARRGAHLDLAVERLQATEREADELGLRPLVARARASLRQAGVRAAPRAGGRGQGLSVREQEVLELVGEGLSTGEIAQRLGIARSTVETQVGSAMRKLGARTRVQAAAMARAGAAT